MAMTLITKRCTVTDPETEDQRLDSKSVTIVNMQAVGLFVAMLHDRLSVLTTRAVYLTNQLVPVLYLHS